MVTTVSFGRSVVPLDSTRLQHPKGIISEPGQRWLDGSSKQTKKRRRRRKKRTVTILETQRVCTDPRVQPPLALKLSSSLLSSRPSFFFYLFISYQHFYETFFLFFPHSLASFFFKEKHPSIWLLAASTSAAVPHTTIHSAIHSEASE